MKIIFYRSKQNGKLFNFHFSDPKWDDEELNRRINETNKNNKHFTVFAVEADECMTFLYEKATERKRYNKEIVSEALESIRAAEEAISSLYNEGEEK